MKNTKNIQQVYFRAFLRLLIPVIILSAVILCGLQYSSVYTQSADTIRQTCTTVAQNIDLQIRQMNAICLNTISSSDMRNTLEQLTGDSYLSQSEYIRLRSHLSSVLTSLKGFDYSIRQLSVYSMEEAGFGAGLRNGRLSTNAKSQPWYEAVVAQNGKMYIAPPAMAPDLASYAKSASDKYFVSLYHMYFNSYHHPLGIVEVRKYYDDVVDESIQNTVTFPMDIYIYGPDGQVIYPLPQEGKVLPSPEDFLHKPVYFEKCVSSKYDFTIITAVNRTDLLLLASRSIIWIIVTFALILLLMQLFSRRIAMQISAPIRRIHNFLSATDRNQFSELDFEATSITEIDDLQHSINDRIRAQKTASDTLLTLKESELQAQMLALQSQMNPHFLYNSLSTIAEMAREGLTEEVVDMAVSISQILREISSNKEQISTVEDELELTSLYLGCIKARYKKELEYRFEIPDEMLDYSLPKLSVQSLVENSIKFVTKVSPPWQVTIRGVIHEDHWTITVLDNGPGFDPQIDEHLRHQMDSILENGLLPSLQIEGMGILNIFIRLYLLNGIPFVFDFGNRTEGGAFITIGGYIHETDQTLSDPSGR